MPVALVMLVACESGSQPPKSAAGPERVEVQHILISFRGTGTDARRSKEEAAALAREVYERARRGESFTDLMKRYSSDPGEGIYRMANDGVNPNPGESPRRQMVKSFGDVAFHLNVGEIGLAEYDPVHSKYGWHIIKRLK